MKHERRVVICLMLGAVILAGVCLAQVKKEGSPFDKYRQSSVNELEFRKAKFDVASIRSSIQPTPLPKGLGAPFIEGEAPNGKLIIEVQVYSGDLPQTVNGRKDALMQAVDVSRAAFSYGFSTVDSIQYFDKWTVIQFSDTEKFDKAVKEKSVKPVDPYVAYYENGELILR